MFLHAVVLCIGILWHWEVRVFNESVRVISDQSDGDAFAGRAGEGVKNAAKGAKRSASEVIKEALAKAGN